MPPAIVESEIETIHGIPLDDASIEVSGGCQVRQDEKAGQMEVDVITDEFARREEMRAIIAAEMEAIRNIPMDGSVEAAVDCFVERVHNRGGKVVISGMGKSGQIGANIASTLCSTGTPAIFLHPSEAQHGDLGMLQRHDVLLLISNSGNTSEILTLAELSQRLYEAMPIIGLTGSRECELSDYCDITICTGSPKEVCPLGFTPTTSTTVTKVVGDMLVVGTMKAIGFTKAEYSKRHFGGCLGIRSKNESS